MLGQADFTQCLSNSLPDVVKITSLLPFFLDQGKAHLLLFQQVPYILTADNLEFGMIISD